MPSSDNVLHLVIADDSLNDAEQLVSVLRNSGMAVRPNRVRDDEELEHVLAGQHQDLFLCVPGLGNLPMETAMRIVEQSGKDIPMLVLSEDEDHELRREVMGMGAVDLVRKSDADHFRHAVQRELRNLRERRRVRRLEAALRETERRCHALLDSSRDAIGYVHEGMHVYANTSYLERFGFTSFEELEGLPVLDLAAPEDQGRFKAFLRAYANGEQDDDRIELSVEQQDGETSSVLMEFSAASWDGEPCTQILIREQAASAELEARLADLSRQDSLTGLANRTYFLEAFDHAVADTLRDDAGGQIGLLYVEPDNLDALRETLGISAIDRIVADVAGIVSEHIGEGDLAGRFSDDVITAMLPGRGVHEALAVAEAIRGSVEEHISEVGSRSITKTCSIGVVIVGDGVGGGDQAVNLASQACGLARREGGDRVHLHAAERTADSDGPGSWAPRIEEALAEDGFYLLFQPLVSLTGDQVPRYEARLRLRDEQGREVRPGEFMPDAEQHGLAARIDTWVMNAALDQLAERRQAGQTTLLFVKISGATLADDAFVETLAAGLDERGLDGASLVFELNEPVAVTQLNQAKAFYKAVKELRCGFALDQFGSGLNSFQLVKHLPAEYLKLDRTLTEGLTDDAESQETVREIVANAHEMRKQVIAGYLEQATVLAMLWQYEVDLVQGHFLGEPMPAMDFDFNAMII